MVHISWYVVDVALFSVLIPKLPVCVFSGMLSYATSMGSQAEMGMNSVERMTEYLEYDSEAPPILPDNRCRAFASRLLEHACLAPVSYTHLRAH